MANYISYRLASAVSRRLPKPMAYWVGLRIADFFYFFHRAKREAVRDNLSCVLEYRGVRQTPRALRGLTRKTFQNFGKYLVDFFRYTRVERNALEKMISIEHLDHLDNACRAGRGVIIVTAHFGNWELGGAMLRALGHQVNAVVAPARMPRLQDFLQKPREERGLRTVTIGSSIRVLLRALRQGELVALLADRDFSGERERLSLFGKSVRLPRGAAWLALRAQAPIVPAFLVRQEDDTFLLRFHPPILPDAASGEQELMSRVRDAMEREVGERPSQWFVFHRFWEAEPSLTE